MIPPETHRARHRLRIERQIRLLERRSRIFSWARLTLVIFGAIIAFWIFRSYGSGPGTATAAAAVLLFILLIKTHDRVEDGLKRFRVHLRIKELHERRRHLDWDALPEPLDFTVERGHPFSGDLNLVGRRSLHHLLDTCVSHGGSVRLKVWLTETEPNYDRTLHRQHLVRHLVPLALFRDRLTLRTALRLPNGSRRWKERELLDWLEREEVVPQLKPWVIGLGTFAAVNLLLIIGHVAGWLPLLWPVTVLIYFAIYFSRYRAVKNLFDESHELEKTLEQFKPALLYLERFRFESGSAADVVSHPLRSVRPSQELKSLQRIASASTFTRNEVMWLLLNLLLPWEMLFTYLMHRTKRSLRGHLPAWLDAWYSLEAASALASFADHHPDRPFPVLYAPEQPESTDGSDETDGAFERYADAGGADSEKPARPIFEGVGLGHPLLHEDVKVRNDFTLDRLGQVVLVTGSNMSGKSTFLRTIGINLQLAFAGGPVDARALRTGLFRVFTSINITDSVQDGLSHFYAEVQRLKMLLNALDSDAGPPLFNLIDEIFRGTNNRERLIGSRAFIHALAGRRAASLISTHDLELTSLEEEVPLLSNFHFREDVSGERMTFDYRLRPGPCPTTNALKIMSRAGLPVAPSEPK